MSRYIDVEDVKLLLWGYTNGDVDLLKKIDKIESKDVAPVIHAHWTDCNGKYVRVDSYVSPTSLGLYCSHCHEELIASDEYYVAGRYCPSCGARMDESER